MRLWSLHPKYLDNKGLVAVWREGLLARKVLEGKTKGYKNHPQLIRFKEFKTPLSAIDSFLYFVFIEAKSRDFSFDGKKIRKLNRKKFIDVSRGQIIFEFNHLLKKVKKRDFNKFCELNKKKSLIRSNPVFRIVKGDVESWENI
jgi:hypothetical protein